MTYLILGEKSLINLEIDKILKQETDYSLIKYDLEEDSIFKVIDELNTVDLFSSKKIVVVNSFEKLEKDEEEKEELDEEEQKQIKEKTSEKNKELINYLEKSKDDNILILTALKVDERKKIVKLIRQNGKVIDTSNTNIDSFVKEELKGYKIDFRALNMLKEYTNYNYYKIVQEINKLKMLKQEEKEITTDDIKSIVKKGFDKNIFDFIKAIDEKNYKKIFEIYYELIDNKEDELKIIATLANTFRLLYKLKILVKVKTDNELMTIFKIKKPYRLMKLKEEAYAYDKNKLLKYLKELSELDISIKSGSIDKKLGMEMFLTKI